MFRREARALLAGSVDRRRFTADWLVNFAGLGVLAVSGLLINTLVVRAYDSATLGNFMLVLAIFLIVAQVATLGVQYSILQASSAHGVNDETLSSILLSGLLPAVASGVAGSVLAFAAGALWPESELSAPLQLAAAGVAFCALNKCLLSFLNGVHRNQAVAVLNALRPLAILSVLVGLILAGAPGWAISVSLVIEEVVLFVAAVATITTGLDLRKGRPSLTWVSRHLSFGWRSMPGGIAAEANTRADILVLGMFASPAQVGIYAFAQSVIEGLLQLPQITRRIIDPICARLVVEDRHDELNRISRTILRYSASGYVVMALAAIAAYPIAIGWILRVPDADQQWPLFCILVVGATVSATYTGFCGYLMQGGRPGVQTWLEIVLLAINTLGCLVLTPILGATGAAIGKSIAFAAHGAGLRYLIHRYLGVRL